MGLSSENIRKRHLVFFQILQTVQEILEVAFTLEEHQVFTTETLVRFEERLARADDRDKNMALAGLRHINVH